MLDLCGKICLVTGSSRGVGKGIAVQLAINGATCYVTGRNLETLEKLNKEVESMGGSSKCIPIQCDHENDDEVERVFQQIDRENDGQLDLLVNNAYSGVTHLMTNVGKTFWEQSPNTWDLYNNVGLRNNYRCAIFASKLMIKRRKGLIINLSSIGGMKYLFSVPYAIGKCAKDRMAHDCAIELKEHNVAFVSLWPGLVRTEIVADRIEQTKQGKQLGDKLETPIYVGQTVAALLSEPHSKIMQNTGRILLTTDIGREHNITDEIGIIPTHPFQLNFVLRLAGFETLAKFIPDFIRIPFSLLRMIEAYKR